MRNCKRLGYLMKKARFFCSKKKEKWFYNRVKSWDTWANRLVTRKPKIKEPRLKGTRKKIKRALSQLGQATVEPVKSGIGQILAKNGHSVVVWIDDPLVLFFKMVIYEFEGFGGDVYAREDRLLVSRVLANQSLQSRHVGFDVSLAEWKWQAILEVVEASKGERAVGRRKTHVIMGLRFDVPCARGFNIVKPDEEFRAAGRSTSSIECAGKSVNVACGFTTTIGRRFRRFRRFEGILVIGKTNFPRLISTATTANFGPSRR